MKFRLVPCLLILSSWAQAAADPLAGLDDYIARTMSTFQVPGVAIAVVQDGKVVLAKGYGVRKWGLAPKVDEHTRFGIGSNTKAFTAAALAILIDEGKIGWDDRVVDRLPGFQMYDPYVSHEMTIRDLLTHRSGMGLGEGDLLFFPPSDYTSAQLVHQLRYMKPASSFRSKYAYDNLMYLVAGQIIPAVTGKSWQETIRTRIFQPLQMTESNTSISEFRPGDNVAAPHALVEGKLVPITPTQIDNNAPAGAINSSVSDMTKWILTQLDAGVMSGSGERLFTKERSREMWSAQTIIPFSEPPAELAPLKTDFQAYGLGWVLTDYRGHKHVSHTGGLTGFVSQVSLLPELRLGIVILTNAETDFSLGALSHRLMDRFLGVPDYDWLTAFAKIDQEQKASASEVERKEAQARPANSKPSLPLSQYAGAYADAWYGRIDIALEHDKLVMRFTHSPALTGDLEHFQFDTFKVRWRDRSLAADAYVTFALNPEGTIREAKMRPVSPLTDFSYDFQDLTIVPVTKK